MFSTVVETITENNTYEITKVKNSGNYFYNIYYFSHLYIILPIMSYVYATGLYYLYNLT